MQIQTGKNVDFCNTICCVYIHNIFLTLYHVTRLSMPGTLARFVDRRLDVYTRACTAAMHFLLLTCVPYNYYTSVGRPCCVF